MVIFTSLSVLLLALREQSESNQKKDELNLKFDAQDGIRTRDLQISQETLSASSKLPYESGALTD